MKLEIGQGIFGRDLDEIYGNLFEKIRIPEIAKALYILIRTTSRSVVAAKDTHCVDIILKNTSNLKKVALIGAKLPVTYMIRIQNRYPDVEFITINDSEMMVMGEAYLKDIFKYTNYNINPIFHDLSDHIKDCNLVIYPETELLVPFKYLRYKHTMPYFCANFIYYPNIVNTNEIYSEEDLLEICEMKNPIICGSKKVIFSGNSKKYYYALGYDS